MYLGVPLVLIFLRPLGATTILTYLNSLGVRGRKVADPVLSEERETTRISRGFIPTKD